MSDSSASAASPDPPQPQLPHQVNKAPGLNGEQAIVVVQQPGLIRGLLGWRDKAPWNTRFYSTNRVQDWLSVLGLRTLRRESVFYQPPVQHAGVLRGLRFLNAFRHVFPHSGAVYVLKARKHTVPLTPTRWRWSSRRGLVPGGFARPTSGVG